MQEQRFFQKDKQEPGTILRATSTAPSLHPRPPVYEMLRRDGIELSKAPTWAEILAAKKTAQTAAALTA